MKIRFLWIGLLSCCSLIGNAQTATYKSLAYDTLLAAAARRGEVPKRLNYREMAVVGNRAQTNVVFVYKKQNDYYAKVFVVKGGMPDSLVTYPEQKLTSQKMRNACATYFAQVLRYQKMPKYEYRGNPATPLAQAPPSPQWIVRVVAIEPPKRPFTAMFHHMDAHDYPAEDAATIRRMNRDFAVLRKAMHEYARENNIPVGP